MGLSRNTNVLGGVAKQCKYNPKASERKKIIHMNRLSKAGCMSREVWLKYSPEASEPTNHKYALIF